MDDTMHAISDLVVRGGTCEGAARVTKSVAQRHRVSMTERITLPRLTRAERQERTVRPFPMPKGETA